MNPSRRKFIKKNIKNLITVSALSSTSFLSSCVSSSKPVLTKTSGQYPRLAGKKIQSPEHYGMQGCMTGLYVNSTRLKHVYTGPLKQASIKHIDLYQMNDCSASHIYYVISASTITEMRDSVQEGSIPFITFDARASRNNKSSNLKFLKELADGEHADKIKESAVMLRNFGEKYGGFFIRTMREMNLPRWPWSGDSSRFKKIWIHIWNIFEDVGANEYATWVFNPYVAHGCDVGVDYYPGDKYVDWIGMNGYNQIGHFGGSIESFYNLFHSGYVYLRKNFNHKPLMIAETRCFQHPNKPQWVEDAFQTVKNDFPDLKALCWWDENWLNYRYSLIGELDTKIYSSPEAFKAFRLGISNPYYLSTIPYRI